MPALRIAHLTATFPPYWGGTGTVAFNQSAGLAARGHDVHVFTGTAGDAADDPPGVMVHRLKPVFAIGNAPLLPSLARLPDFDLVHLHHPFIFGTDMTLLRRLGRNAPALVVTYHNRLIGERGRAPLFWAYEETMVRTAVRVAERVCVVSMDHADSVGHVRSARRRHPARFVEVPNGVDVEQFQPGADKTGIRSELGLPADTPVAVFAAALDRAHHFKRLDHVLEALARIRDPLELLVIGGGDMFDDYQALTARLGLTERVHFTGPQPHGKLPALLAAGDFFVLATEPPESFGLVLVEAMAAGVPVIASNIPGVRTIPEHETSGLLVSPGVDALAEAMRTLAADEGARRRMGAAARARAEGVYAWPRVFDKLEQVYEDALTERRR